MKAQDLKNSILQLAIQGKLVEQRKEEGTAKELIEQIKAEKEKLTKEKKIKKETPLDELTEEDIPFDIPPNWEWVKLGEVVSVNGGKRIPAGRTLTDEDTGYKYIRVADMKNGSILLDDIKYIPHDIYPKIKNYTISKDDIYITVAGTIGQVGLVPEELDNANLTENADKLVIYSNFKEFMYYMLSSNFIQYQIKEHTTKVGQPKLAIKRIKELIIPLPPLEEQKRIVAKIEELMPYVEKYDKAYTEVEELNQKFPEDMQKSILQYAIQGKLVEQREEDGTAEELYQQIQAEKEKLIKEGKIKKNKPLPAITEDEIPFEIPKNWKWVRLGSLAELITKGSSPSWQGIKYVNQGLLFVTSENVGIEQLLLDNPKYLEEKFNELQGRSILKKNDILTNIVGASIGRTTIYDRDELANINQAVCLIRLINSNMNGYIVKYLNSYVAYKIMMNDKVDTARANISLTNISDFVVPLPPLAEQKRIVEKIEKLLPYTKQLIKKID